MHNRMQQLCNALDIPILAPEMMMNDVDLCAQWLISGAPDGPGWGAVWDFDQFQKKLVTTY